MKKEKPIKIGDIEIPVYSDAKMKADEVGFVTMDSGIIEDSKLHAWSVNEDRVVPEFESIINSKITIGAWLNRKRVMIKGPVSKRKVEMMKALKIIDSEEDLEVL